MPSTGKFQAGELLKTRNSEGELLLLFGFLGKKSLKFRL